ncbi:hypothetical protein O0L34_g8276 [Tuta absoluta]|nr:hypothetical protein O0L34_g8276 [Tuta absoluta]
MARFFITKPSSKTTAKVRDVPTTADHCEMYTCLRWLMRLARWFGLFPLEGMNSPGIARLRFNLKSFYGLYLFMSVLGQFIMAVIAFWTLIWSQLALARLTHTFLYVGSFVCLVLLIDLAKIWPSLLKEIAAIEKDVSVKLKKEALTWIFWSMLLGVVFYAAEHILCYIYVIHFAMQCFQDTLWSYEVWDMVFTLKLQAFLQYDNPDTFHFLSGALFEFTNAQAKFISSWIDLLVICHSIYLGFYFKALNSFIESQRNNESVNWGDLRYQYARLAILVKKVNDRLSYFVLISFSSNLYFTVLQLFNSLRTPQYEFGPCNHEGALEATTGTMHEIFYNFSFSFLIMKIFMVSLLSANVHTYACQPVSYLGEVHASKYSKEIQRFYRQITYTTIGVDGVFFFVTREMILKVLGTLITYELVLLQFTHNNTTITNTTQNINETGGYKKFTFTL